MVRLFRGKSIESLRLRMSRFAEEFGVELVIPEHMPNTRRALAMSEYARDRGVLDRFRDIASRAYWQEHLDLENEEHLAEIAARADLEPAAALDASSAPAMVERVLQIRQQGMEQMVTGVPTLFVKGMPIVGCQRYETFEKVFERAGVPRR